MRKAPRSTSSKAQQHKTNTKYDPRVPGRKPVIEITSCQMLGPKFITQASLLNSSITIYKIEVYDLEA